MVPPRRRYRMRRPCRFPNLGRACRRSIKVKLIGDRVRNLSEGHPTIRFGLCAAPSWKARPWDGQMRTATTLIPIVIAPGALHSKCQGIWPPPDHSIISDEGEKVITNCSRCSWYDYQGCDNASRTSAETGPLSSSSAEIQERDSSGSRKKIHTDLTAQCPFWGL